MIPRSSHFISLEMMPRTAFANSQSKKRCSWVSGFLQKWHLPSPSFQLVLCLTGCAWQMRVYWKDLTLSWGNVALFIALAFAASSRKGANVHTLVLGGGVVGLSWEVTSKISW